MRVQFYIKKDASQDVVQKRFHDVSRAINGGIEFGAPPHVPPVLGEEPNGLKNMQGFWVDITTPGAPDTEFTVDHNLQYVPTGILVFSVDKAAVIYASRKNQWTATQAFFKANLATVSLQAFVA